MTWGERSADNLETPVFVSDVLLLLDSSFELLELLCHIVCLFT